MARPIRNPFYYLLVTACGLLLVTMLTYVVGWFYVPNPDRPAPEPPMPGPMAWIDRNALWLIASEVVAILALGLLTIATDRWFDRTGRGEDCGDA
jgi:hypothetical protein